MLIYHFQKYNISLLSLSNISIRYEFLLISFLLMPLNWFLESYRWKTILKNLFSISWIQSIKSILVGTAIGFVTPARIGDYAGRILYIPEKYRITSLACIFFNSIIQNGVHVMGALVFSIFFIQEYWPSFFSTNFTTLFVILILTLIVVVLYSFPAIISFLVGIFRRYKFLAWVEHFEFIKGINPSVISKIILLSILRYCIYFFQYLLILQALEVSFSWSQLSSAVAFIYLLQSGIPLPPVLNFLGRAEIALLVFGHIHIAPAIALWATFILWAINLVIPSIIGYCLILRENKLTIK